MLSEKQRIQLLKDSTSLVEPEDLLPCSKEPFPFPIESRVCGLMRFRDRSDKVTELNFVQISVKLRRRPWQ
jgi:hypothetical protein